MNNWTLEKQQVVSNKNKIHLNEIEKTLTDYLDDKEYKKRQKEQICKYCYYIADKRNFTKAFYYTGCKNCGRYMEFDLFKFDTKVTVLCEDCANKTNSCCKCGGLMD